MIQLQDIKLNPNNPRTVGDDKLQKLIKSIKEFPKMLELRPIVINEDNIILGGNMRFSQYIVKAIIAVLDTPFFYLLTKNRDE